VFVVEMELEIVVLLTQICELQIIYSQMAFS